jgi:hypothetical protein
LSGPDRGRGSREQDEARRKQMCYKSQHEKLLKNVMIRIREMRICGNYELSPFRPGTMRISTDCT